MSCPHIRIHAEGDAPVDEVAEDATELAMLIETTAERIFVRSRVVNFDIGADADSLPERAGERCDYVARVALARARTFWFEAYELRNLHIDEAIALARRKRSQEATQ